MTIENRVVRYQDLIPCTNAFIDTRSPGSDQKENFTVIGPGVAENPDQHVHISIPHGFNIGGARQPANCLNSQHSHLTEEVFVVQSGEWDFITGVNANDGRITLQPGDIISIPMDVFRGFECVKGEESGVDAGKGYLHAVLGGDDPGRVLWAPSVFEMASDFGLILLEDGSLVDTTLGETVPDGKKTMPVTTQAQINEHRVVSSDALNDIIIRTRDFDWRKDTILSQFSGVSEVSLVGGANQEEGVKASKLGWKHGFVVRALKLEPDATIPAHIRAEEEVIFVHQGQLAITVDGETIELNAGDNFTTPIGSVRRFENTGVKPGVYYVTRGGDLPKAPEFL
ncbi:cupin domain-containing protein [Thalassotalea sp. PS06]|uniref:cupin domain-containing protein n=1 Tax=Thalassotalea sp. PS06 TaxID=2594005 RepID=UPI0011645ABB|nr:cupin domain-containing protein [Thalassotalea sp. PS06]QDP01012.1 cupin domain-containing protein [Thalassotalea sp. PS06]